MGVLGTFRVSKLKNEIISCDPIMIGRAESTTVPADAVIPELSLAAQLMAPNVVPNRNKNVPRISCKVAILVSRRK